MAVLSGPGITAGAPGQVDSTQLNPLGTIAQDKDGNHYIYLLGVASTAIGSVVTFDEAHVTTLAVANAKGRVAVATAACVAATYGWYQVFGKASAKVLAAFADNGNLYLTSTAGSLDDAVVAGDALIGAVGRSAVDGAGTGLAYIEMNYPFVSDITAL